MLYTWNQYWISTRIQLKNKEANETEHILWYKTSHEKAVKNSKMMTVLEWQIHVFLLFNLSEMWLIRMKTNYIFKTCISRG